MNPASIAEVVSLLLVILLLLNVGFLAGAWWGTRHRSEVRDILDALTRHIDDRRQMVARDAAAYHGPVGRAMIGARQDELLALEHTFLEGDHWREPHDLAV